MDSPLRPSQLPEQNSRGVHDWAGLAISEGQSFVESQDGYSAINDTIKAIMGSSGDDKLRPAAISQLSLNHVGKIALDLASSLTDIKPFFTYKVSNTRFEPQADMGQK